MSDLVKKLPLFDGIADPDLAEGISKLPHRKFPQGMVVFEEGELSDEVYAILSGTVEIVHPGPDGELIRIALLNPGEMFGEFSYLSGEPRSSAALAVETTELVEMSASWLSAVQKKHPQVEKRLTDLYRTRVLINVLRGSKLFGRLEPKQLEEVSRRMSWREAKDGEEILKEGSAGLDLIVIKRGRVRITRKRAAEIVNLGEIGTGDVLGEMAIVTGEPRSASAFAKGPCELMTLPGDDFRAALDTYPLLLKSIEDIVRSRAEENRRALDAVVSEVIGDSWTDVDETAGIQVSSLNLTATWTAGDTKGDGKLTRVSRTQWLLTMEASSPLPAVGTDGMIAVGSSRIKELAPLVASPFPGRVSSVVERQVTVQMSDTEETSARLTNMVTVLARARLRLFIYPEYDVEKLAAVVEVRRGRDSREDAILTTLSQTHARLTSLGDWPTGEMATIVFRWNEKEWLTTRALCLKEEDGKREIQFEYETGTERTALESFLRELARALGFIQTAATARTESIQRSRFDHVVTKSFSTPQAFLKTYMGSMEAGLLRVESKEKISRGTAVRILAAIAGKQKFAFTGYVREWANGEAEVDLDDLAPSLREKIEGLCKKLVEERSDASWEKRKRALAEAGVKVPAAPKERVWAKVAAAVIIIGASIWWAWRLGPTQPPAPTQAAKESREVRDEPLTLQTKGGPVTIRVSEIRSIKVTPGDGGLVVQAHGKSYELASQGPTGLSPSLQKHVERLNVLRGKK